MNESPQDPASIPPEKDPSLSDLGRAVLGGGSSASGSRPTGPWLPPTAEELQALLPQYQILTMLGRGGMGAVYMGRQISLDRPVAIKILSGALEESDLGFKERFKNEARAMAKLNHPGIVSVYDSGETADGLLFIVMEYVDGTDVARMIASEGRLHTEHAMAIAAHVCDALAYAHSEGIIHRDIKPANIMVGYNGAVKVADFGLAKVHTPEGNSLGLTMSGMAMGTMHYIAPEAMLDGPPVDHRADLYAVGVMLYQMLTGRLPQGMFTMPSLQVPGLDPRFDAIIARAMMQEPEERYQAATEFRVALDQILTQPVEKAEPASPAAPARVPLLPSEVRPKRPGMKQMGDLPSRSHPKSAPPRPRRGVWPWVVVGAVVLGLGAYFLIQGGLPGKNAPVSVTEVPQGGPGGTGTTKAESSATPLLSTAKTNSTVGIDLLSASDLSNWSGDIDKFQLVDGVLSTGSPRSDLIYPKDLGDFILTFDLRVNAGGYAEVSILGQDPPQPTSGAPNASFGVVMRDDSDPSMVALESWKKHGAVFGYQAPLARAMGPVGTWNAHEIKVQNQHLFVKVNGVVVQDIRFADFVRKAPGGRSLDLTRTRGLLSIIAFNGRVDFRNLRLQEIPAEAEGGLTRVSSQSDGVASPAPFPAEEGWISLFNGVDLSGWEPQPSDFPARVEDGAIRLDGATSIPVSGNLYYRGEGASLPEWTDYEVVATVKTGNLGNSGIILHSRPRQPDRNRAEGVEVQILNNPSLGVNAKHPGWRSGGLQRLADSGIPVADGEWFQVKARVEGKKVTTWMKRPAESEWRVGATWTQPENWNAFPDRPEIRLGKGTVSLQNNPPVDGVVWFKDLYYRSLTPAAAIGVSAVPSGGPSASAGMDASEWTHLFNRKTLVGWQAEPANMPVSVENGMMVIRGVRTREEGGHLFFTGSGTLQSGFPEWTDFEAMVTLKTSKLGNSGFKFHTRAVPGEQGLTVNGIEVNLWNEGMTFPVDREHRTGSAFGIAPVAVSHFKDEEWFTVRILVEGKRLRTWLQKEGATDWIPAVDWTQPDNWESLEKKNQSRRISSGTIAFTNWVPAEGEVWIKEVKVKLPSRSLALGTAASSAAPAVQTFNGNRYQFIPGSLSWSEAKAQAESLGGHLATITSKEENDWIVKTYGGLLEVPNRNLWLGAIEESASSGWKWVTGEPFAPIGWVENEPNGIQGGGGQVGHPFMLNLYSFRGGLVGWNDSSTHFSQVRDNVGFIVEWEGITPETQAPTTGMPNTNSPETLLGRWYRTNMTQPGAPFEMDLSQGGDALWMGDGQTSKGTWGLLPDASIRVEWKSGWTYFLNVDFRNPVTLSGDAKGPGGENEPVRFERSAAASAPTLWTDLKGRTLQADFVRVDGENVVLNIKGKETPVSLVTLSPESQEQARSLATAAAVPASRYSLVTETTTWAAARAKALGMGGDLAKIESQAEQDYLVECFGGGLAPQQGYWIGGSQTDSSSPWKWSDGTAIGTFLWHQGEPNNTTAKFPGQNMPPFYLCLYRGESHGWNDLSESDSRWREVVKGFLVEFTAAVSQAGGNELPENTADAGSRKPERVYKSTPQGELKLHFTFPGESGAAGNLRPAIIYFFGGGWKTGSVDQFAEDADHFARLGLVAVRAEYRVRNPHGTTPMDAVEDAKSAIRWLRAHASEYGIDPQRIVAAGGSAGGHLAACATLDNGFQAVDEDQRVSHKPNALVLFNPDLSVSEMFQKGKLADAGLTAASAEALTPLSWINATTPPTILFFGTRDEWKPGGDEYVRRARALGVTAEMWTAKGADHAFFSRPPWTDPVRKRTEQFLASLGYLEVPKDSVAVPSGPDLVPE